MANILLAALNAKFIHPSLGLRYLRANLGALRGQSELVEYDLRRSPEEMAGDLLSRNPRIVGMGVSIWNARLVSDLAGCLKRSDPEVALVLGGPEISHETECQPIAQLADWVIAGEADLAFAELCHKVLSGHPPPRGIIRADPPDLEHVVLPYDEYSEHDLTTRLTYVETTRGCPYGCEFCLSSIDPRVRRFPLENVLLQIERLIERGARRLKFIDRTFNADIPSACRIIDFLAARYRPGLQAHFEMVPDRFPPPLFESIQRAPPGLLRFEIGVQTVNPEVAERVRCRRDLTMLETTLRRLLDCGVHLHVDLIVGLPGETPEGVAAGFDRLVRCGPQEIQLGILKRLRGTPLKRHDSAWGMVYRTDPPYDILENRLVPRSLMDRYKHMAAFWERMANRGRFPATLPLLWKEADSPFATFLQWSDWLYARFGRTHSIPLPALVAALRDYLIHGLGIDPGAVDTALRLDGQLPPPRSVSGARRRNTK